MSNLQDTCLDDDGTTHDDVFCDIDKAKLWDDMKEYLKRCSIGRSWESGSSPVGSMGIDISLLVLNHMEQEEIFARVRNDLRVKA